MGQLNGTRITSALKKLFSALDSTDDDLVMNAVGARRKVGVHVSDGGTAATAQTATPFTTNDSGSNARVTAVNVILPVAVTGDNTNNAVVTLDRVDATGLNPLTIATLTTNVATGNFVAHVPKALTLTSANVVIPAGFTLRIAVSKAGTGVAIAAATSQAYVEVTTELVQ